MASLNKVIELLLSIPYLIKEGPLPPYEVVNDLIKRGNYDAGMSGAVNWKPFEVSEEEYEKIIAELLHLKVGLIRENPPLSVKKFEDWLNWRMIWKVGEEGPELADLYRERAEILRQIKMMRGHIGDTNTGILQLGLIRIDGKIGDLLIAANRKKISHP